MSKEETAESVEGNFGERTEKFSGQASFVEPLTLRGMSRLGEEMKRKSTIIRTYSLGDYKNIKFSDTIENIPEDIALHEEAMHKLRSLQLLQIERSFLRYILLRERTHNMSYEEAIKFVNDLEDKVSRSFTELFEDIVLDNGEEENTDENAENEDKE